MNNLAIRQGEPQAGGSSCSVSVKDNSFKYVGGLTKGGKEDVTRWRGPCKMASYTSFKPRIDDSSCVD